MGPEMVNRLKDSEIHGDFVGRDKITKVIVFQESEREFVVTHNANIKPVSYFSGREKELQELRERIEAGRKSVLVSGMGGIGKTHICRKLFEEYLNKHAEDKNGPFRHIGYIEYTGDMGSSLQNCLKFKQQDSPEQNREAAWRELEYLASDGKLLLFIDNVDKTIGADPGLQILKGIPGAVVLTSRQASFSDEFEPYQIGFLDMEQCVEIYEKIRSGGSGKKINPGEVEDLEYVIENLAGRHTITVEFLAHLARTKLWTVKKLRDELEQKGFRLTFHRDGELVNIQESYEKLYDLSELTEAEQNILEAFSVFPYIPLVVEVCNEWLLADAGANEDDDILMGLYQKGWLQFDGDQEGFTLHPVFTKFINDMCKPKWENHSGLIKSCQDCLGIPGESIIKCRLYIPFAENIIEKLYMEKDKKKALFVDILAYWLQYIGEYEKSEQWFKRSLDIYEDILGKNHIDTVVTYSNLGEIYRKQGKYKEAKELLEKAVSICEKEVGEEHAVVACCYDNLALIYMQQGKNVEAEELLKKSLRIRRNILGEEHTDTAISYNCLANLCDEQGKYVKSEILHKRCLKIRKSVLGEEHPDTAISYNDLGLIYMQQGKNVEAEELLKKSLRIRRNILGEEHTDTAISYNNLALLYTEKGNYTEAEALFNKSMKIIIQVVGEGHPYIANSYDNLAYIYTKRGNYVKAEKLYKKSLQIREDVFGEENRDIANSYINLASVYINQKNYGKAKKLLVKSFYIYRNILGEEHPNIAIIYDYLANLHEYQGDYKKAEELYKKSLRISEKVCGEYHLNTVSRYNNLARVYERWGEYEKAEELYKKNIKINEKVLGEYHLDTAISYNNLAVMYSNWGEYERAEELFGKILRVCEWTLGKEHPDTALNYINIAEVYKHLGEYVKAITYLVKAYKIYVITFGLNHLNTIAAYTNLKILYDICYLNDDFKQWLEEKMKE